MDSVLSYVVPAKEAVSEFVIPAKAARGREPGSRKSAICRNLFWIPDLVCSANLSGMTVQVDQYIASFTKVTAGLPFFHTEGVPYRTSLGFVSPVLMLLFPGVSNGA